MGTLIPRATVAALLVCAAAAARAAGGHFEVDDAAMLETGHCQAEAWVARLPSASVNAVHLGPACRVGPVELGLNLERVRAPGASRSFVGPQLKWVTALLADRLSAGVAWSASFDLAQGGRPAQALVLPFSASVAGNLWLHANLGADRASSGTRTRRIGLAGEWAASERWALLAERMQLAGDWTSRLGTRFSVNPATSIDVSVARAGPRASRLFVIGLNHDFER